MPTFRAGVREQAIGMRTLKLIGKSALATIAVIAVLVVLILLWNVLSRSLLGQFGIENFSSGWIPTLLLIAVFFIPKRPLRIKRPLTIAAETVIDAPIQEVWDEIMPRPRRDYYLPTIAEIRSVPGEPDRFDFVMSNALAQDDKERVLHTQIVASEEPHYLATFVDGIAAVEGVGIDSQSEEAVLVAHGEMTRIQLTNTVSHISLMFLVTLGLIHPLKDALRTLKSRCEGTGDQSWIMRSMDAKRSVIGGGVGTDLAIAGVTVMVVLVGIAGGLIYWAVGTSV